MTSLSASRSGNKKLKDLLSENIFYLFYYQEFFIGRISLLEVIQEFYYSS